MNPSEPPKPRRRLKVGIHASGRPELVYSGLKLNSGEEILQGLEEIPEDQNILSEDLPEAVRGIAAASRKSILLNLKPLRRERVREIYCQLVADIAGHHHPQAENPLHEAKIFDLMLGAARFADMIGSLESKPVLNKLLTIRVSHLLMIKDASDFIVDNPIADKLKKYRVGDILKYSALAYKAIRKKHPGILAKDLAFTLTLEGGRRWFYIYLHNRIVLEANAVYAQKSQAEEGISPAALSL